VLSDDDIGYFLDESGAVFCPQSVDSGEGIVFELLSEIFENISIA